MLLSFITSKGIEFSFLSNYNFSVNLDDNNHIQDKVVTGIKPLALSALTDNRGVLIFSGSEERRDIKL